MGIYTNIETLAVLELKPRPNTFFAYYNWGHFENDAGRGLGSKTLGLRCPGGGGAI